MKIRCHVQNMMVYTDAHLVHYWDRADYEDFLKNKIFIFFDIALLFSWRKCVLELDFGEEGQKKKNI